MPSAAAPTGFWGSFLGRFVTKYLGDEASMYAQVIAYNALFSMFPILLAVVTISGLVLRGSGASDQMLGSLAAALPADASRDVIDALQSTERNAGLLAIVSFVGLLWSGSSLFGAIETGFDHAYGLPSRSFVMSKLMGSVMIFVFAILALLTVTASGAATFLVGFSEDALPFTIPGGKLITTALGYAISIASAFVMFLAVLWVVPNRRFRLSQVWRGALLAAFLFVLVSQIFPIYARYLGGFNRYGATFGLFFLLMTWFFFLGQILMVAVEVNALCAPATETSWASATRPVDPRPIVKPAQPAPGFVTTTRSWLAPIFVTAGIVAGFFWSLLGRRTSVQ
ncbi:MAG: YihY/virulence factor BrkB family protein [Chloroflexi bacterium]|nr:YihY/virulence factor BrkB family protein [Chloroflexota bacterium]